jgi:hypothetical protein
VAVPSEELRLPGIMGRRDRRGWLAALGAGAVLSVPGLVVASLLSEDAAFGFLAILLGMIASVYFGFALRDGRLRTFNIEYLGMVVFGALATIALAEDSAWLLAAGYFGHGLWDAIHHPRGVDTTMPWWYVPLCMSFDAVVAVYVLVRFA